MSQRRLDRRHFLRCGSLGALGATGAFGALLARPARGDAGHGGGYGPLRPALDRTTGLPLIRLPEGFSYATFGWTGDLLLDGTLTPPAHDGMGLVSQGRDGHVLLVRNHEVRGTGAPIAGAPLFDERGRGGTTSLLFDARHGDWVQARASLAGTSTNCAGGATPWGSWLTAEETLDGRTQGYAEDHGFVFEVPADEPAHPIALRALGRFSHEAVAVDPRTGFLYLTEDDRYTSGLYRFRPVQPHLLFGLEQGGVLEMLRVHGLDQADLQQVRRGDRFDVEWVAIAEPDADPVDGVGPFGSFDGQTTSASGPFVQGFERGAARFRRLEGIAYDDGDEVLYFADTEGAPPAVDSGRPEGAIWRYDPRREELRVIHASSAQALLDNPDNVAVSPRGGILLCEDGDLSGQRLTGLSSNGRLFPFAQNDVVLHGERNGFAGDYRGSEWAGAVFDREGEWLFVNLQSPGITFAISGPWERGGL